jgi:hypothetical protein
VRVRVTVSEELKTDNQHTQRLQDYKTTELQAMIYTVLDLYIERDTSVQISILIIVCMTMYDDDMFAHVFTRAMFFVWW